MIILSLIFFRFTLELLEILEIIYLKLRLLSEHMLGYFLVHTGAVLDVCKEDKSLESAHTFPLI